MMDSSTTTTPAPLLKNKLSHIKLLLDDANHRLRDEADIFTTKTSASVTVKTNGGGGQNGHQRQHLPPAELRRTIADISTIQSVLSCPIFNQIANVTDSLDKLTYHLNLRPSIGPADIEFNKNGELVLAPPVEPTSLNNLINSQLDEYSNLPNSSQLQQQQQQQQHLVQSNQVAQANNSTLANAASLNVTQAPLSPSNGTRNIEQHQFAAQHQQQNATNYYTEFANNQVQQQQHQQQQQQQQQQQSNQGELMGSPNTSGGAQMHEPLACNQNYANPQANIVPSSAVAQQQQQRRCEYDTEKLLGAEATSGAALAQGPTYAVASNGARRPPTKVQSTAAMFENAFAADANRGLYKANGHAALNQMAAPQNSADTRMDFETTRSMGQINEQSMSSESSQQTLGYTNELYKATSHEPDHLNVDRPDSYVSGAQPPSQQQQQQQPPMMQQQRDHVIGKSNAAGPQTNGKRASPATSADLPMNAKLADECDSGTSSFRSKGALCSPQPHKPLAVGHMLGDSEPEPIDSSIDQELIEKLSPEMERIKVTLEKGSSGLGITIAGYMCEQEEISGIFIKSITPGSPADRSGKIRVLDQIFAVNGQEILGYSNPQAVNVLRQQSRVVTLDLMRYLAESKYKKLQTLLEHAAPSASLQKSSASAAHSNFSSSSSADAFQQTKAQPVVSSVNSPKRVEPPQSIESMYNNSSAFMSNSNSGKSSQKPLDGATSPVPVAAQRTAATAAHYGQSSKVIETKQGARNKIDIRSPLTSSSSAAAAAAAAATAAASPMQTTATYVNDPSNSGGNNCLQQQHEWAEDLCQLEKLEWAKSVQIVELRRESTQSLGFTIKDYANPENPQQSIFMIVSITAGGIADQSGQLSIGDLLKFVDDTNLENSSLSDAVRALRRTSDQVRLGILKYLRN